MRHLALIGLVAVTLLAGCSEPETHERVNVVVILADDLGYGDVSYTGGDLATPEIDRLAREGTILDRFYCQPKCTPTRAGLLTGRHPIRFGMQHHVVAPWETYGLPKHERTLAEGFRDAAYPHRALFGKWHLGHAEADHHPLEHGFTEFVGHMNGRIDYFTHHRLADDAGKPIPDWHRGRELEDVQGHYVTDLITREAVSFLEKRAADREPFFLTLSHLAPHFPNQAPPSWVKLFDHMEEPRRTYAAKVKALDAAIGQVRRALDDNGLSQNTLVLFLSDNGADPTKGGSNGALAGQKHTPYEGGVRCPAILRWPGRVPAGVTCEAMTSYVDVFPTLAKLIGFPEGALDGRDRWGQWIEEAEDDEPNQHYVFMRSEDGRELISLMDDEFKLVRIGMQPWDMTMPREDVKLFRYREDPEEIGDCQKVYPDKVKDMLKDLARFRALGSRRSDPQLKVQAVPADGWVPPADWRPGAHAAR